MFHSGRSTYLYDTLRPRLIHEGNLDALCELVDILKVEVLGEQLSRRGELVAGLRSTLQRILADIHERLAFCARTHIREEVDIHSDLFFWNAFMISMRIYTNWSNPIKILKFIAHSCSVIHVTRARQHVEI